VTNKFPYESLASVGPEENSADQIKLDVTNQGVFIYQTAYRSQLLCQLFEICSKNTKKFRSLGVFKSSRIDKNRVHVDGFLEATPYGIVEYDKGNRILQEYYYCNIAKIGTDPSQHAIFFEYSARIKVFTLPKLEQIYINIKTQSQAIGICNIQYIPNNTLQEILDIRANFYKSTGSSVAYFDVHKLTRRSSRPVHRQLHIS